MSMPTCGPRNQLRETLARLRSQQQRFCAVVTDDNVVLGMFYADRQPDSDATTVEQVMHPGPPTVRASEPVEPLLARMRAAGIDGILVTDPEGRLLGLLDRPRVEPSQTEPAGQHQA
jgi:CBS domain-containing protein